MHNRAKRFLLCGSCGRTLKAPPPATAGGGRRRARARSNQQDIYGHAAGCPRAGIPLQPLALVTFSSAQVLRLIVPVPEPSDADLRSLQSWGLTLGYSLRVGMRRLYMLDGPEIEFDVAGPWRTQDGTPGFWQMSLAFIDPSLGGSGYLPRIAQELHRVARRALEHLDHPGCETACYRCLKSYQNQPFHELLEWPRIVADLEALAEKVPVVRPLETGDLDDPRPWLEAYAAGVGSPLELRFLRLFEQHAFHPSKQVRVAAIDGGPPSLLLILPYPRDAWPFTLMVRRFTRDPTSDVTASFAIGCATVTHPGAWSSFELLIWRGEGPWLRNSASSVSRRVDSSQIKVPTTELLESGQRVLGRPPENSSPFFLGMASQA